MTAVHGIDFSGAQDAGDHIWLTRGRLDGGILRVHDVLPAAELPGGAQDRDAALAALRHLITASGRGAFGIDAPFGLPSKLVEDDGWHSFAAGFGDRFQDPEAFREACQAAGDQELRRVTDDETGTPMSPYNLRVYKQTYHVIRDVLAPLAEKGHARVLPVDDPTPGHPWLLEVCPAVTLEEEGIQEAYKGHGPDRREGRLRLLRQLEALHSISLPSRDLRARILEDPYGDALDSLVAAHAVARNVSDPSRLVPRGQGPYKLEGYVYV